MLARLCSKSFKLTFSSSWTKNFQMVQAGFRKDRGTKDQIANICWIIEKARNSTKTSVSLTTLKPVTVADNKLWKILKMKGIPHRLTCLLRNLYVGQEATVRTGHGTTNWFKIGKGVQQGCILSLCLFNLYAEYIMQDAGLDDSQVRIKIARRNSNNFRCADDTTLMVGREKELRSLLVNVKEENEKLA